MNDRTKTSIKFSEIRQEIILGNRNITFNNKVLIFTTWIDSGLIYIYINYILDDDGTINERSILTKSKNKSNWPSEYTKL